MLAPPPRPSLDEPKLRAERRRLRRKRAAQVQMHTEGILTDDELRASLRDLRDRLDRIDAQLAVSDEPDPLPEFRDGRPAAEVWAGLGMPRRRAVVQALVERIVINRAGGRGRGFDPGTLEVTWAPGV
jgi:hypothetical protein